MDYKKQTIKELRIYYQLKTKSIPNLKNKIECLDTQLIGVKAIQYSDMPTGKGEKSNLNKEKLLDEKNKVLERLKKNNAHYEYMDKALSKLNATDRGLLIECYAKDRFERLTEYMICKKLNISRSTLHRRKIEVIEEFAIDLYGIEAI